VLNGAVLKADPTLVHVLVTDMAGEDGIGSFFGTLDDADPEYYAEAWGPGNPRPPHSFAGELTAVQRDLRRRADALRASGSARPPATLLVTVMDSLSAVQSLNNGRCKDPLGNDLLRMLYDDAARLNMTLIGVWHYRELNTLADRLSHLAVVLGRGSASGRLSELPWTRADAGTGVRGRWIEGSDGSHSLEPCAIIQSRARNDR
jgi:hypothetical protein